jgi:hypothetical protein
VPEADAGRLAQAAKAALYRHLNPLTGGPEGRGWPFGRSVTSAELLGVLQRRLGVEVPEAVHLYRNDRATGARAAGGWTNKIELGPGTLPFAAEHTVVLA